MAERPGLTSLAEVLRLTLRERPSRDASPREWMRFHHRNANLFALAMRVDPQFKFEASVYASGSLRIAREIEHQHGLTYLRDL